MAGRRSAWICPGVDAEEDLDMPRHAAVDNVSAGQPVRLEPEQASALLKIVSNSSRTAGVGSGAIVADPPTDVGRAAMPGDWTPLRPQPSGPATTAS